jgi:hypothetical protein
MKNQNGFFRKTVFTVVMLVWCGVMSHLSAQQICVGETYEIEINIHNATTLDAEWVTGNEGTGTVPQPLLAADNVTWTWLYESVPQDADKIIKVRLYTDFSNKYCSEGDEIVFQFTVTKCNTYTVYGTVFPFVHTGEEDFDDMFETTAKLYNVPPKTVLDKLGYIRKQTPLQTVRVEYYDCTVDEVIIGAPKDPGVMGNTNNPGLPIRWEDIGVISISPIDNPLTETDKCPFAPIGKYIFEDVAAGEYVLEISRQGFLTRYGVIKVEGDDYLGHRELLGGDVNGDLVINAKDISTLPIAILGTSAYKCRYDINGDRNINSFDINIIQVNLGAYVTIYQETFDFITNL